MEYLILVIGTQLRSLATLHSDLDQEIDEEMTNMGEDSAFFTIARSGNAGRSRYVITQEQIHGLWKALGFRRVNIVRILGMSTRALSRRRQLQQKLISNSATNTLSTFRDAMSRITIQYKLVPISSS